MNQSLDGINGLEDLMSCNDMFCRIDIHRKQISEYCIKFVHICIDGGEKSLPLCSPCKKLKAYWAELIQPHKECSLFGIPCG